MQCDTLQASRLSTRRACNRAKERNYKISVRISASINTVIRRIPERIAYAEGERISGVLGIRKMQVPRQRPFVTETTAAHRGTCSRSASMRLRRVMLPPALRAGEFARLLAPVCPTCRFQPPTAVCLLLSTRRTSPVDCSLRSHLRQRSIAA